MNNDLKKAIERLKEVKAVLKKFVNREEAIRFLIKKTKLSKEECTSAYDIIMKIDLDKL